MTMRTYLPSEHPPGGPRPPAEGEDVPDTVDPVEARRIQAAIDEAAANFAALERRQLGRRRP